MYQKRIAYGKGGFPWTADVYKGRVSYEKGICPVAETLEDESFLQIGLCVFTFTAREIDQIIGAFIKVWDHLSDLRGQ